MALSSRSLVVLPTALLALAAAPSAHAACDQCNVLWIVIDATRVDYVGCHGNGDGNTPNIDKLAARGQVYDYAYAQGAATLPSVSSYLSGRYRLATGMDYTIFKRDELYHPMTDQVTTLAEVLGDAGWRTLGVTANTIISKGTAFDLNLHQGFESYETVEDADATQRAIDLLDEVKDERFLLYLHLMGPHAPNAQLDGFAQRRGSFEGELLPSTSSTYVKVNNGKLTLTDTQQAYLQALYADGIWEADALAGKVLDKLAELGLDDETLVIFTSDHGEALGDVQGGKAKWGHGHVLKEPLLHVPLVIAGPGVPSGVHVTDRVAELVDLAPTMTSFLGIPTQDAWHWEGAPLFGAGAEAGQWSIADQGIPPKISANIRNATHSVAGHFEDGKPKFFRYFDLASDPGEQKNVAATAEHQALRDQLKDYMINAKPPEQGAATVAPDDETLQQLEALGYTEQ